MLITALMSFLVAVYYVSISIIEIKSDLLDLFTPYCFEPYVHMHKPKAERRFRSSHELTCPEPAFDLQVCDLQVQVLIL